MKLELLTGVNLLSQYSAWETLNINFTIKQLSMQMQFYKKEELKESINQVLGIIMPVYKMITLTGKMIYGKI